ncbi:glycosyltransferase family 61 protein [Falsiroseomonas oryziterrae]|uniref:glycosyltransferase family 61 protein n=1 Tax=Falsiroseomonas oryziterrae TaxID=2911368 RepID=UPI001F2E7771|nr:glycosyltransferase 61 family protein [Roseomonas sp. NPKOSM-4]
MNWPRPAYGAPEGDVDPPVIPDIGDQRFAHAPKIPAAQIPDAQLLAILDPSSEVTGLSARVRFPGLLEGLECRARAGFLTGAPYRVPAAAFWAVPRLRLLQAPRAEGMCFSADGALVRETRGSPRVLPGNDMFRWAGGAAFLNRELRPTGAVARGAVCYDSASRNFAHLMMIMLPRVMLADATLSETPILLPDLPDYPGAAIRNELLFRLGEVLPLSRGNFYAPLGHGVWALDEALVPSAGSSRWDLVLHPTVRTGFARIAAEALRRCARLTARESTWPRRIYVSRQGATRRRITNGEEAERVLVARGFEAVQLEQLDIFEQAALFAEAEAVVAVHGAGLANLLFNDGRARVLELYPAGAPQYHFALCAAAQGCIYVPLACENRSKQHDVQVDLKALDRALDLLFA